MKSAAFANYNDVTLTLIGLGLFLGVFIGSLIWVNLKENRRLYDQISKSILDEGDHHE
jgi:cbb3-type cytochrome oxidase subunit 3